MKDRIHTNRSLTAPPVAALEQQDEQLRRARIATAQAAVDRTSKRLANTYLPGLDRRALAREHDTNLRRLAVLRIEDGTGTLTDHRLINPVATAAAEERFWASNDSWDTAGRQLTADLAAISTSGARV